MTLQTLALLRVLLDEPAAPFYGLEVSRRAGLKGGTVYPTLARLEQAGWLTSSWEQVDESAAGRPRRRLYRLTPDGVTQARDALDAQVARLTPSTNPFGGPRRVGEQIA